MVSRTIVFWSGTATLREDKITVEDISRDMNVLQQEVCISSVIIDSDAKVEVPAESGLFAGRGLREDEGISHQTLVPGAAIRVCFCGDASGTPSVLFTHFLEWSSTRVPRAGTVLWSAQKDNVIAGLKTFEHLSLSLTVARDFRCQRISDQRGKDVGTKGNRHH